MIICYIFTIHLNTFLENCLGRVKIAEKVKKRRTYNLYEPIVDGNLIFGHR